MVQSHPKLASAKTIGKKKEKEGKGYKKKRQRLKTTIDRIP